MIFNLRNHNIWGFSGPTDRMPKGQSLGIGVFNFMLSAVVGSHRKTMSHCLNMSITFFVRQWLGHRSRGSIASMRLLHAHFQCILPICPMCISTASVQIIMPVPFTGTRPSEALRRLVLALIPMTSLCSFSAVIPAES